jgi:hypothetical protein
MMYPRRRPSRDVDTPIRQHPKHLMSIFRFEPKDSPLMGTAIPSCVLVAIGIEETGLTLVHGCVTLNNLIHAAQSK